MLLIAGLTFARIAEEIDVSQPTLRKHYFQNGRVSWRRARAAALAEARAANLLQLQARGDEGSVAALNAVRQILDREALAAMDDDLARRDAPRREGRARSRDVAPAPRAPSPGKKVGDEIAAREAELEFGARIEGGKVH